MYQCSTKDGSHILTSNVYLLLSQLRLFTHFWPYAKCSRRSGYAHGLAITGKRSRCLLLILRWYQISHLSSHWWLVYTRPTATFSGCSRHLPHPIAAVIRWPSIQPPQWSLRPLPNISDNKEWVLNPHFPTYRKSRNKKFQAHPATSSDKLF